MDDVDSRDGSLESIEWLVFFFLLSFFLSFSKNVKIQQPLYGIDSLSLSRCEIQVKSPLKNKNENVTNCDVVLGSGSNVGSWFSVTCKSQ